MSPDDRTRLRHMVDAMAAAERFIQARSRADLDNDQMLVFALVRSIEIVGEAASRMTASGRAELPAVPWSGIIGMRNRLIHGYFDVDLDILWNTVTGSLPALQAQILPSVVQPAPEPDKGPR